MGFAFEPLIGFSPQDDSRTFQELFSKSASKIVNQGTCLFWQPFDWHIEIYKLSYCDFLYHLLILTDKKYSVLLFWFECAIRVSIWKIVMWPYLVCPAIHVILQWRGNDIESIIIKVMKILLYWIDYVIINCRHNSYE